MPGFLHHFIVRSEPVNISISTRHSENSLGTPTPQQNSRVIQKLALKIATVSAGDHEQNMKARKVLAVPARASLDPNLPYLSNANYRVYLCPWR